MEPYNVPENTGDHKRGGLNFSVFAGQIENRAEKQGGGTAVHNKAVAGQDGKSQEIQCKLEDRVRKRRHENRRKKGEKQRKEYGGETAPPFSLRAPFKSLQEDDENRERGEHLILREETVRSDKCTADIIERKLYGAHEYRDQVDAQKVYFAVVGVGEAFDQAE